MAARQGKGNAGFFSAKPPRGAIVVRHRVCEMGRPAETRLALPAKRPRGWGRMLSPGGSVLGAGVNGGKGGHGRYTGFAKFGP